MISLFIFHSLSLPPITKSVYFDLAYGKRRLGRIEIGLCGNACPHEVAAIIKGVECKDYCYTGTNISDFNSFDSFTIGSKLKTNVEGNDPVTGTNRQAHLVCAASTGGAATAKFTITLRANSDVDYGANPIGKLISGQKVIEKMNEIATLDEDTSSIRITGCGMSDFEDDDDLDL